MSETKKLTGTQWIVLAAAFLGWMFDGVEIGLFPVVARDALRDLLQTSDDALIGKWNGVIGACFLLGAACGGVAFGWLGDKIGRVRSMVLSVLIYSVFTGVGGMATAVWQLGACRFIASLGMGGEWALAVALVMECWPERHRPKLAGAIGAAANFGFLLIAIVALIIALYEVETARSWRWMMFIGAAPAALALLISLFVPESQRWKDSVKRGASKPIQEIFAPGLRRRTILAIVFSAIPLIGTWAAVSGWTPLWADQLAHEQFAKPFLSDQANAKLDVEKVSKERQKILKESLTDEHWVQVNRQARPVKAVVQIALAIGAIMGCFIAPVVGAIWGRRPVYFALCLLSLLACGYFYGFLDTYNAEFLIVAGIAGGVTAAFYGWLPLYLPELFPTRIRATGQGLSFNFGRVLAAFGALNMGALVSFLGGNYATASLIICTIYFVGLVVIWLAPETKGQPLPE